MNQQTKDEGRWVRNKFECKWEEVNGVNVMLMPHGVLISSFGEDREPMQFIPNPDGCVAEINEHRLVWHYVGED